MNSLDKISILIAEDNEISRELLAGILKTQRYQTILASDGTEAIDVLGREMVDLALVDLNMEPKGGFDFIRYLIANGIDLPVIVITADDSHDVLTRASELGVTRLLQKPVDPERLMSTVRQVLRKHGHNLEPLAIETHDTCYTPDQLMQRAIDLAERNAKMKKGGPFGAVVANAKGEVLGEGVNGITSRVDPTAHAEIMAIRQAAERLGRSDLSDCVLYCSSTPTMMGQALTISVGIEKVYYGLSHDEIAELRARDNKVRRILTDKNAVDYTQLGHDSAVTMFKRWQSMDERLND